MWNRRVVPGGPPTPLVRVLAWTVFALAVTFALAHIRGSDPRLVSMASVFDGRLTNTGDPSPSIAAMSRLLGNPRADLYAGLSRTGSSFIYPPLAAALYYPFAGIPVGAARDRLVDVDHVLLIVAIALAATLWVRRGPRDATTGVAWVVGAALCFYPLTRALELNQSSLVITVLVGFALLALDDGRQHRAGVLLACAIAIKPHLALMLPLLWWHARPTLRAASIACVILACVSLAFAGVANHVAYVTKVLPLLANGYAFHPNQSWNGLFLRLFDAPNIDSFVIAQPSRLASICALACSVATYALAARHVWKLRATEISPTTLFGFAWLISTLSSPIAWEHHYAPAIFLFVVCLRRDARTVKARELAAIAVAFVLLAGYVGMAGLPDAVARVVVSYRFVGALLLAWIVARRLVEVSSSPAEEPEVPVRPQLARSVTRGVIAVLLILSVYWLSHLVRYHHGRDQGIYAVVARTMLAGGAPYKDAWDFKPPGIFIAFAIGRAIFGAGMHGVRVFEALCIASLFPAFAIIGRRFFGSARAGLFGAALATLTYVQLEFWHTGQPEGYGGVALAWAFVLGTSDGDTTSTRSAFGSGMLYGLAAWMKPTLGVAILPALFFAVRRRESKRSIVGMIAGVASSFLLVAGYLAARGAFGEFRQAVLVFAPHYTAVSLQPAQLPAGTVRALFDSIVTYSAYAPLGVVLLFWLPKAGDREREGVVQILALVAGPVFGVALQAKFFEYHFATALLFFALLAGVGFHKAWEHIAGRPWIAAAALVVVWLLHDARTATRGIGSFWDRCIRRDAALFSAEPSTVLDGLYSVADVSERRNRLLTEWIRAHSTKDDRVYIWGFEPVIYDAADRQSPTRYIYNVPQRSPWSRDAARRELMTSLEKTPPLIVVIAHGDSLPVVTGNHRDSAQVLAFYPELAAFLSAGYAVRQKIEGFDVLVRVR